MKRQPPAPKYVLRCLSCGGLIANGNVSWTVHNKACRHDDACPARSALSPTKEA